MSIVPSSDSVMAGDPLSLTCSATVQEGISGTPTFSWSRDDGALPDDVDDASPLLSFPSLRTSHGGGYTCTARLSIPEAGVNVFDTNSVNVSVQSMLSRLYQCKYDIDALISLCSSAAFSYHHWLS